MVLMTFCRRAGEPATLSAGLRADNDKAQSSAFSALLRHAFPGTRALFRTQSPHGYLPTQMSRTSVYPAHSGDTAPNISTGPTLFIVTF